MRGRLPPACRATGRALRAGPTLPRRLGGVGWLAAWMLLALLAAQALGLAHRVAHGPAQARAVAGAVEAKLGHPGHPGHPSRGPGLFDDHGAGGAECRLLDQAAHADVLTPGVAATAALDSAAPPPAAQPRQRPVAGWAAYFARGPPRPTSRGAQAA